MATSLGLQPPRKKSKKTLAAFKAEHAERYGLRVASRDTVESVVTACVCWFCEVFGREDDKRLESTSRKKTKTIKYFATFRTDLYIRHLSKDHQTKWGQYQQLASESEKRDFFSRVAVPYKNQLGVHFDSSHALHSAIKAPIVDIIIGELLFHPEGLGGTTYKRALSLFSLSSTRSGFYDVEIKTARRYALLVSIVATGVSFRQAARILQLVRDQTDLAYLGGASDTIASNYARVVCADALQKLSEVFDALTGFSIAADSATANGTSFLDLRARFTISGALYNVHLLALPLYDRHTGQLLANVIIKFLDSLHAPWRDILVGVATDGARFMTGRARGVATLLENEIEGRTLIRIWCGLHQLDLVLQRVFKSAQNDTFFSTLTSAIGHLRRQQSLITDMQATCPKIADTSNKNPEFAPAISWWVFLFAVHAFAREASQRVKSVQGLSTLIDQQRAAFNALVLKYCEMTKMSGPLSEFDLGLVDRSCNEVCGRFVLSHSHAHEFLDDLDAWVVQALSQMSVVAAHTIAVAVAKLFVQGANGIYEITDTNQGTSSQVLPSILPFQLVRMSMHEFNALLCEHSGRLSKRISPTEIHKVGQDFSSLRHAYRSDIGVKKALDDEGHAAMSFTDAWSRFGDRFPNLMSFCGDLFSVFPNTSTVESDFSVIGWERDVYRQSTTNFSLEGVLQCKQYDLLGQLSKLSA